MSAVTFGDLARAATEDLQAAAQLPAVGLEHDSVASALTQARRVVHALARYLDEMIFGNEVEAIIGQDAGTTIRAAAHAREALQMAAASLRLAEDAFVTNGSKAGPLAASLAKAAALLTAGRDLLGTHFVIDLGGTRSPASYWSAVVTSDPVSAALLDKIARWSAQLATWAMRLSAGTAGDVTIPNTVRQELGGARRWLLLAGAAIEEARHPGQLTAGSMLLQAIPGNFVPEPSPVSGAEPVALLCQGIAISAARLRAVAGGSSGHAAWSPDVTAESWRWAATATAVISDMSELLLSALAGHAEQVCGLPGTTRQLLTDAAEAAANACASWREVAAAWGLMTTETRGLTAQGVADTGDVVIRIGRLTFADPLWDPARSRRASVRDPADIAPGAEQAAMVLAAVHDTADALAIKSVADLGAVDAAVRAGRLYAPTHSLPEWYDVPRPFGSATPADTGRLLRRYGSAAAASSQLATALDIVAVELGAPSQVLAAVRAAGRSVGGADTVRSEAGQVVDTVRVAVSGGGGLAVPPGQVEQQVRQLGVEDPLILLRAKAIDKAIDKATQKLIAQASGESRPPGTASRPAAAGRHRQAAGTAITVATQSFPQRPAVPMPGGQIPGARAGHSRTRTGTIPDVPRHRSAMG